MNLLRSGKNRVGALGLTLALIGVACATPPSAPAAPITTAAPQAASPTAAPEIAEFSVAGIIQTTTLDTAKTGSDAAGASLVSERLEVAKLDGTFIPLAAATTTVSAEKIVYQLRPDMRFSDGKPVTADDVAYSIQRAADPKAAPATAALLSMVGNVQTTSPTEVTVTLKTPDPRARPNLAYAARVWQKAQVESDPQAFGSAAAIPIGSGPFVVAQFTTSEVVFERNENYWGRKPSIKKIRWKWIPDESTKQLAMRSGEIHLAYSTNVGAAADWKAVPGATVNAHPSILVHMFSLDTSKAPFDDVHVRRAFAYAIDRANLLKVIYGEYGRALKGMVPAEMLAQVSSPAEAEQFLSSLPQYEFDLTKARAELAQSKYASGFTVEAHTSTGFPHGSPVLQHLQQNLRPLGVQINIQATPFQQWAAKLRERKDLGMFAWQYGALSGDPVNLLANFLGSARLTGPNTANWAPPELEQPLAVLASGADKAARLDATKTLLSAVASEVPWIPLFSPSVLYVTGSGFKYDTSRGDAYDISFGTWVDYVSAGQ